MAFSFMATYNMCEMKKEEILLKIFGNNASIDYPLVGGMMNESYIVTKDNKQYVMYISTAQANEMVDRKLEKEHIDIIYPLGITSKNVYFDTELGIKANEFIQGTSIDKINEFNYSKIASLFHKLHNSKKLSKLDYDPFKRFIGYESEAKSFVGEFEEDFITIRDYLFGYKDFLESQPKVLCHNDAQRSNIVKSIDDEYFFIDFEFVGNNDEIYDIACFGNGSVQEGRNLLDAYFNCPTAEQVKRYYLWRIYVSLQWYTVALVKHYRGEGKVHGFDFLGVAKHFLDNAKECYQKLTK